METKIYRAQLRSKGRLTLPSEVRSLLRIKEGDDVMFSVEPGGRIMIQPLPVIDPDQAWFWSERWQKMEREAQADIDEGRVMRFESVEDAVKNIKE